MEYLIDFNQGVDPTQINNYLATNNLSVVKVFDNFELVYLVRGDSTPPMDGIIENIINDSTNQIQPLEYTYVVPENTAPTTTFDLEDHKQWWKTFSCATLNLNESSATVKRKGAGVRVYILDSGIDDSHTEFQDVTIKKLFSITDSFTDTSGHGTAIASLISGRTCGLTESELNIIKIFDANTPTKLSDMIGALDAVINDFITNPELGGILNLSWSIPRNNYVEQKIQMLIDLGLMVVCSAGNNGSAITDVTPACMPAVLTIGAYNQDFLPCDFSNFTGESVISLTNSPTNYGALDGWAPGIDIWAATPGDSFGFVAGTSMSAAIVTGALSYNLSNAMNDNGELAVQLVGGRSSLNDIANYSISRTGLLTLEGDYAGSVNKIATYSVSKSIKAFIPVVRGYFKKGQRNSVKLFHSDIIKSVTYTDLPAGLSIENGWIIGEPLDELGSAGYQIRELEMTMTLIDDSTSQVHLTLALLDPNLDLTGVDNNQLLNIMTAAVCSGTSCDPLACGEFSCNDANYPKTPFNCSCFVL